MFQAKQNKTKKEKHKHVFLLLFLFWDWRDDLRVKSTYCSSKAPSSVPSIQSSLQEPKTPVPGVPYPLLSSKATHIHVADKHKHAFVWGVVLWLNLGLDYMIIHKYWNKTSLAFLWSQWGGMLVLFSEEQHIYFYSFSLMECAGYLVGCWLDEILIKG